MKLGLVFSGGGVRALAHAGLLKALEEKGLEPSIISGTSGGALVGALYACEVKPDDMAQFFKDTPVFKWSMLTFRKVGLVDSAKYTKFFKKHFKCPTFEELKLPLIVTATNLLNGKVQYFNKGELIQPLIASAALPPYFSPVRIGDSLYCDGGLLNNFPIEPLKNQCDTIIGSFVNPLETITEKDLSNSFQFMQRIYNITMDGNYNRKFKKCDHLLLHNLSDISVLDTTHLDRAFEYGYEMAMKQLTIDN
ncbi:phospholipase [Capnocytophaga sp. HP1101]